MKIMINLEGTDDCREFNIVQNDMKVLELKKHLSKIYNIPYNQMEILLNDFPLNDKQVVSQVGIGDNLLTLKKVNQNLSQSRPILNLPQSQDLANADTRIRQNPNRIITNQNTNSRQNQNLAYSNVYTPQTPILSNSISNRTPNLGNSFAYNPQNNLGNSQVNNPLGLSTSSLLNDAIAYNNLLGISMNSPEAQRRIEKIIHQQRINDNLRQAAEFMPESLVPVHMLYINVEINNKKVAALVDTGAQSTFMSLELCNRCGLMNMVDKRFQGIAHGVGASRIIGVIHAAQIKIMNKMIATKINVIENNEVGLVFGLDSLRSHRCNVDLKINALVFPDIGISAKFLSDGEIKKMKEQRLVDEENDEIERAKQASLNYV